MNKNANFFPLILGSHHNYEGDQPWWTLRFFKKLTTIEVKDVESIIALTNLFEPPEWTNARQCEIGEVDPFFEDQEEWNNYYQEVEQFFTKLHQKYPLFAIFFQKGQFWANSGEIVDLDDNELLKLFEEKK